MTSPTLDVSVIIPVRNEASVLAETARSMLAQRFDGTLEFIFVDGESDDGSVEILAELSAADHRVTVLTNPARIEPAALNIGVRHARGTYVSLLNAHCRFPDDYLAQGVARLQAGDATWVTGPAIPLGRDRFSTAVASALVLPLGAGGSNKWRDADAPAEDELELDTGLFAGVVRRATLESLGPFDEQWTVNHDSEMAGRVLDAGGRIVQLFSMGAYYHPRANPRGLWRQYWRFGYYRVRTSQRHPVALRRFHLAAAVLALTPVAALLAPRALARPARLGLAVYGAGLARAVAGVRGDLPARTATAGALATMHFGWGTGFLAGIARYGLPLRGILRLLGFGGTQRP
jgi:succinoglycan biosynthesis protein ExoA